PLIGLGEVHYEGKIQPSAEVLKKHKLGPLKLKAKEGLALLNGTQFMSALGCWNTWHAWRIFNQSNRIASVSLDAFDCRKEPFIEQLQKIRPHEGQKVVAAAIRTHLNGSAIQEKQKTAVQDPYSFRCIPQVHGATYDALIFINKTIETEINSVTDNPTLFPEENMVVSGGNFHGQPLAMAMDLLAIAVSELASISERRTYKLISGQRGLPPFLAKHAGKHSGFMIPQYTAASIVSRNKQLCTPSVVDTIDSSNGQEDHVSMGANSAVKCREVILNSERVIAIEFMTAAQALEFRKPLKSSEELEKWIADYRKVVPFLEEDTVMNEVMQKAIGFVFGG
ncbi:MAG: histidine ammonia-lyase, partial [Flavobacteriales bacterium]